MATKTIQPTSVTNRYYLAGLWLGALFFIVAAISVASLVDSWLPLLLPALLLLVGLGVLLWLHPKFALWLLIVILPFHNTITFTMIGVLGLPTGLSSAFATWKEALLLLVLSRIMFDILVTGKFPFKLNWLDILILAYIALSAAYIFIPNDLTSLSIRARGFKVDAFFFLAYFAGRSLRWSRRDIKRVVITLLALGGIVALVAVIEKFVLPEGFLVQFGYIRWAIFLGYDPYDTRLFFSPVWLPASFYSWIGSYLYKRVGSIYIGSLTLSFALLIFIPLAVSIFIHLKRDRRRRIVAGLIVLLLAAMALAYTRSAIASLIIALSLLAWFRLRSDSRLVVSSAIPLAVTIILSLLALTIAGQLLLKAGFGDRSTELHIEGWLVSLEQMAERPLGSGLGTAGALTLRFLANKGLRNESWYFQIGTEMGILAALLFVLITLGWLVMSLNYAKRLFDPLLKSFAWGLFIAGVALAIDGLFLHVWSESSIALTYWSLAGMLSKVVWIDL